MFKAWSLLILLILNVSTGSASTETRGGGNLEAAEFADLGRAAIQRAMPYTPIRILSESFDVAKLEKKFRNTKIALSETPLFLVGQKVAAINDWKANSVIIDLETWKTYDLPGKKRLVLHELVGLLKGPTLDATYGYSDLIDRLTRSIDLLAGTTKFECRDSRSNRTYVISEAGFGTLCTNISSQCGINGVPLRNFRTDGSRKSYVFSAGFDREIANGTIAQVRSCQKADASRLSDSEYLLTATLKGAATTYGEESVSACCSMLEPTKPSLE